MCEILHGMSLSLRHAQEGLLPKLCFETIGLVFAPMEPGDMQLEGFSEALN